MTPGNPLLAARTVCQSLWLDDIHRGLLDSSDFARWVTDGVAGVTSNPAILEKAISQHADYDREIATEVAPGATAVQIYERLAVEDLRRAADLLRPVYDLADGQDGFVSLEVSPHIAHDTQATLSEARRLWQAFDRPNAMIKVPATLAGLSATSQLIADGVNINVTLLFSPQRYLAVLDAWMSGLEARLAQGLPLDRVASVASFFVSRIDARIDPLLPADTPSQALRGKAAIALSSQCYEHWLETISDQRWQHLAAASAHPQRLLWASMAVKDPNYPELKYVEALVLSNTVSTLPLPTLQAFRDHGVVTGRGTQDWRHTLEALQTRGIDLESVAAELEQQGVQKFIDAYQRLMETLHGHGAQ